MKNFFTISILICISSMNLNYEKPAFSSIDAASVQVPEGSEFSPETKSFTGIIDAVSTVEGKAKITVRDERGLQTVFYVASDAAIIGKDGNVTALSWIKGDRVSIAYTITSKGVRTAKSIKALSDFIK